MKQCQMSTLNPAKAGSNEIQSPKWKTYDPRFSYQREKYFDIESFELHLTFGFWNLDFKTCLGFRPAKAGFGSGYVGSGCSMF